jgi:hypothetical protein
MIKLLEWMFRARTRAIHPNKLINRHMQSKNTVSGDDTPPFMITTTGRAFGAARVPSIFVEVVLCPLRGSVGASSRSKCGR